MTLTLESAAAAASSLCTGCIPQTLPTSDAFPLLPFAEDGSFNIPPSRLIYDFVPCKINNTDACKGDACRLGGTSIEGRVLLHDSIFFLDIDQELRLDRFISLAWQSTSYVFLVTR
jgi:hypothetical protein